MPELVNYDYFHAKAAISSVTSIFCLKWLQNRVFAYSKYQQVNLPDVKMPFHVLNDDIDIRLLLNNFETFSMVVL